MICHGYLCGQWPWNAPPTDQLKQTDPAIFHYLGIFWDLNLFFQADFILKLYLHCPPFKAISFSLSCFWFIAMFLVYNLS